MSTKTVYAFFLKIVLFLFLVSNDWDIFWSTRVCSPDALAQDFAFFAFSIPSNDNVLICWEYFCACYDLFYTPSTFVRSHAWSMFLGNNWNFPNGILYHCISYSLANMKVSQTEFQFHLKPSGIGTYKPRNCSKKCNNRNERQQKSPILCKIKSFYIKRLFSKRRTNKMIVLLKVFFFRKGTSQKSEMNRAERATFTYMQRHLIFIRCKTHAIGSYSTTTGDREIKRQQQRTGAQLPWNIVHISDTYTQAQCFMLCDCFFLCLYGPTKKRTFVIDILRTGSS